MRAASMPGALRDQQRLGQHRVRAADDELVDHLRRESAARRSHVRESGCELRHERGDARDVAGFAARHHGQRSAAGRRRPARDGRVDPPATRLSREGGPRTRGRVSTLTVEKSTTSCGGRSAARHTVGAEHRVLHGLGRRQVEQNEIAIARGARPENARPRRPRRALPPSAAARCRTRARDGRATRRRLIIGSPMRPTPT